MDPVIEIGTIIAIACWVLVQVVRGAWYFLDR